MLIRNSGSLLKSILVLAAVLVSAPASQAAEYTPDLGILEILANPATQSQTGLSPELTAKFQDLKSQRLEIFHALYGENSKVEQEVVTQEFRRASEQLALSLLTVSQRTKVNRLQFNKDGLASLLKPEVRTAISISDKQAAAIRAHIKHRDELSGNSTETEAARLRTLTERKLYAILNTNLITRLILGWYHEIKKLLLTHESEKVFN